MNRLIYNCCEGKVSDIKALEHSTYFEFCTILDNFLSKVDSHNKEVDKMNARRKAAGVKSKSAKK